jgi:hypothetical protein
VWTSLARYPGGYWNRLLCGPLGLLDFEGPIWRPERESEWELIKILLEGDGVGVLDRQPTKGSTRGR